jgi:predicted protein tyrosine phosphatase
LRPLRVLFVCSRNRRRSPTAETVFATWRGIEVASAGLKPDADNPLDAEQLGWSELIVVMERRHRDELRRRFRAQLRDQRVICLDIPDDYERDDPALVALLRARMSRHLPPAT